MTELIEIEYHNFFSVAHQVVPLRDQGVVLVVGNIGQGKTALFIEGVYYALFGQSFEYGANPGKAIMNRWSKTFLVRLDLEVSGQRWRIIRHRGFKDCDGYPLNRDGLILLTQTGSAWEERSQSQGKDTQKLINQLIGMTPMSFCSASMFSADALRLPDFSDSERKQVVEELLGIGSLERASEVTAKEVEALTGELQMAAVLLDQTKAEHELRTERLREAQAAADDWERKFRERAAELQREQAKAEAELTTAKQIAATSSAPPDPDLKARLEALREQRAPLADKLSKVRAVHKKVLLEKPEVTASGAKLREAQAALTALSCSECGRPFAEADQAGAERRVEELRAALQRARQDDADALREWEADVAAVEGKENELEAEAERLSAAVEDADRTWRSDEKRAAGEQEDRQRAVNRIAALEEVLESLRQRAYQDAEANPWPLQLKRLTDDVARLAASVADAESQQQQRLGQLDNEKVLARLFGIKGCRLDMLEAAMPLLNVKCAEVARLVGIPIMVEFAIRDEHEARAGILEVRVDNPNGAGQYHGNSRGEQRLVDLVILFSLLSLAVATHGGIGQSFFDEAFERIFPDTKNLLLRLIREISSDRNSVFIISHVTEGLDMSLIDRVWTVQEGRLVMGRE